MGKRTVIKIGDVYGKWTVIDLMPHQKANVLVKCSCGIVKKNYSSSLISGKSTQCRSCSSKNNPGNAKRRISGEWLAISDKYSEYKRIARSNKREFLLDVGEFISLIKSKCFYCHKEPEQIHKIYNKDWADDLIYNGIDRLDNSKGYTKDNVVTCCKVCNYMKGPNNYDNFIKMIEIIYKNLVSHG